MGLIAIAPTEVLPMLLSVGAVVGFMLFGRHLKRKRRQRIYQEQIAKPIETYSQRAVELLDRQEMLKKRHELLPFSDTDFREPMSGSTLDAYRRTERDIERIRNLWLEMMEVRQKAESEFGKQKVARPDDVRRLEHLLASGRPPAEMDELCAEVEGQLEALEGSPRAGGAASGRLARQRPGD